MTEIEKIRKKKKRERINNYIYIIVFFIVLYFFLQVIMDNLFYSYKQDESLIKKYDLKYDLIPAPIQKKIAKKQITTQVGDMTIYIDKLASYDITGKVEAIKDYNTSKLASVLKFENDNNFAIDYISPRDLTLSWGKIALKENSGHIYCDQYEASNNGSRFVWIRWDNFLNQKYGVEEIEKNVSNNHVITINKELKNILLKIKNEDIVRIIGYLVEVNTSGGLKWGPSSMIRTDNGDGACEIILAENIVIMPK